MLFASKPARRRMPLLPLIACVLFAARSEVIVGKPSALHFATTVGLLGRALYFLITAARTMRRRAVAPAD